MTDDEILAEMEAGVEWTLDDPPDVVDMTKLEPSELVRKLATIRGALYALPGNQMHGEPQTDEARALHSERTAVLLEMRRRDMM